MEQIRSLTSLSREELLARIEQHMVDAEVTRAEIGQLHAENEALRATLSDMVYCHGHEENELFNTWVHLDSSNEELDNRRAESLNRARYVLARYGTPATPATS